MFKHIKRVRMKNYVTCSEAAKILGISPDRLRHIKDRFDCKKQGGHQQGRLVFRADTLMDCYLR